MKASTEKANKIWAGVEQAAKGCPEWIKPYIKSIAEENAVKCLNGCRVRFISEYMSVQVRS